MRFLTSPVTSPVNISGKLKPRLYYRPYRPQDGLCLMLMCGVSQTDEYGRKERKDVGLYESYKAF